MLLTAALGLKNNKRGVVTSSFRLLNVKIFPLLLASGAIPLPDGILSV